MSSRFTVDGQRAEDREEELGTDIERNGKKSGSETRRSVNNASTNSSGILVFVLGVLLGCFVMYVGSSPSSKKRVMIVQKHLKNVHNRFRASRDTWRNWGEDMDVLPVVPRGEAGETLQRDGKINYNNMDGVEFPKIVWQGWRNADTSKFDNYRVKMIEDNPEWKFNLVTNEEQENFLRETDDEIVQLAYKSFQLLNPKNGAGRADVWRYAVLYYHGGMYLDIDSSCPDFNKVLSVANDNHANVLLTREGNPSRYIANRKATVMWGFISKPKHPLFKNVIKMVWDNMSFDQPREEIVAQGHEMKELTLQFTGTIAFSRAVDMTRIMGQGDDIYMWGKDFEGACNFKAPGLKTLETVKSKCQVVFTIGLEGVGHHGFVFRNNSFLQRLLQLHIRNRVGRSGSHERMYVDNRAKFNQEMFSNRYTELFTYFHEKCHQKLQMTECYSTPSLSFPDDRGPFIRAGVRIEDVKRWNINNKKHRNYLFRHGHPINVEKFYFEGSKFCEIKFILLHRNLAESVLSHELWDTGWKAHKEILLMFAQYIDSSLKLIPREAWIRINYEDFWRPKEERELILNKLAVFLNWQASPEEALSASKFRLNVSKNIYDEKKCRQIQSLEEIQRDNLDKLGVYSSPFSHPLLLNLTYFRKDSPSLKWYNESCKW